MVHTHTLTHSLVPSCVLYIVCIHAPEHWNAHTSNPSHHYMHQSLKIDTKPSIATAACYVCPLHIDRDIPSLRIELRYSLFSQWRHIQRRTTYVRTYVVAWSVPYTMYVEKHVDSTLAIKWSVRKKQKEKLNQTHQILATHKNIHTQIHATKNIHTGNTMEAGPWVPSLENWGGRLKSLLWTQLLPCYSPIISMHNTISHWRTCFINTI